MGIDQQTGADIDSQTSQDTQSTEASAANAEVSRRKIAEVLSDINTFLLSVAQTRDFFKGYSLSEAIQERLDFIGGGEEEKTQAPTKAPTLLGELETLLEEGKEAIAQAKKAIKDEDDPGEAISSDEPTLIGTVPVVTFKMESD